MVYWLLFIGLIATQAAALELPEVVVSDHHARQPLPREDATAATTVILPQVERDRQRTVSDLLDEAVGTSVRRFGGIGSFATLSLRGSSSNQVAIFLDGIPLNGGDSGTVDLSTLPLAALSRIEVYRGASPVGLGGQGIGGVVNLVTLDPERPRSTLSATAGSFGTVEAAVTRSQASGDMDLLAHLQLLHTEGDFSFDDDNGTPLNEMDDERRHRRNNRQDQGSLLLKLAGPLGDSGRWQLSSLTFAREEGVPGIGALHSDSANLRQLREVAALSLSAPRMGPAQEVEARIFADLAELDFDDRMGEIGTGRQDNEDQTRSLGITLRGSRPHGDRHLATLLLQGLEERYTATNHLTDPESSDDQRRNILTIALEERLRPWEGRLEISPTLRLERYLYDFGGSTTFGGLAREVGERDDTDHLTWKIGGRLDLDVGVSLRATVGRHVREPTFGELFGDRGGVVGNPTLEAERGRTWDAGVEWEGEVGSIAAQAAYTYFDLRLTDLIQLVQTGQRVAVARNIGGARIHGHEVSLDLVAGGALHLGANWTRLESEDRSDDAFARGRALPLRPRDELFLRIAWEGGKIHPFYELSHTAGNHLDRAGLVEVDERTLHDIGVRWRPQQSLTLTAEIDNLTDDDTTDVAGFPLPGRSLRAGAAWSF